MPFAIVLAPRPQPMASPRWALAAAVGLSLLASAAVAQAPATGSLKAAFAAESTVMDPFKYSAGVDQYYISQMFEQLVRPDPGLKDVLESLSVRQSYPQEWLQFRRLLLPSGR